MSSDSDSSDIEIARRLAVEDRNEYVTERETYGAQTSAAISRAETLFGDLVSLDSRSKSMPSTSRTSFFGSREGKLPRKNITYRAGKPVRRSRKGIVVPGFSGVDDPSHPYHFPANSDSEEEAAMASFSNFKDNLLQCATDIKIVTRKVPAHPITPTDTDDELRETSLKLHPRKQKSLQN